MPRSWRIPRRLFIAIIPIVLVAACSSKKKDATGPGASFNGGWSGTTSQAKPFHFLVTNQGIVLSVIGYRVQGATCTTDLVSVLSREPPNQPFAVTDGDFTITSSSSARTYTASGTMFAEGDADGTLNVTAITCNGVSNDTWTATKATGAEVNLTGRWSGPFYTNLVPTATATYTLSQNGSTLSGSTTLPNGASFTISGTVSGRMITFTATETTQGCSGSFSGHGTVLPGSSELLLLYFTGSDCQGAHTGGFGTGTRS